MSDDFRQYVEEKISGLRRDVKDLQERHKLIFTSAFLALVALLMAGAWLLTWILDIVKIALTDP